MNALRAAVLRGARATPRPGSAARSARAGDGFVFSQLREYVEGDDPRRLDQAATARAGTLQTRVYLEETSLVLAAIADESGSMNVGRRRSLSRAADEALRTWFAALEGTDLAARIVGERVIRDRRAAAPARAPAPFPLAAALAIALRALPRGASLLLITDGFETVDDLLLARTALRFDATVLLARDPWYDGLPLRGFVRMRDAESGRVRQAFVGARERLRYRAATRRRAAELEVRFRTAGWRVGALDERDGRASLLRTFGLPA